MTRGIRHLRGPVTLKPTAERLAVKLSLPVFTTNVCRGWDSNIQPSACVIQYVFTHRRRYKTIASFEKEQSIA